MSYEELKQQALKLRGEHWKFSGYLEEEKGNPADYVKLIKILYQKFDVQWQNFVKDCEKKGWDYTVHYPKPIIPEETIQVVITGEWQPLNLNNEE